jgi:hypothetical protein
VLHPSRHGNPLSNRPLPDLRRNLDVSTSAAFRFFSLVIPSAMALALTACTVAQNAAPASPAAAAKPSIPLQPFTASDGSASAGVPAGWKVTQSGGTAIIMAGPQGETVALGNTIIAHNGAFALGQKGPAPSALNMPYSATLAQKLAMIIQQGAALQGQPNPQIAGKSATPVQKSPVLGQCAKFVYTYNGKTAQGQLAPLQAMTFVCSLPPDGAGLYKNIMITAQGPAATAAQSAPTALAIIASYKIPPDWLQKLIAPVLRPQDQAAITQQAQQAMAALAPGMSASNREAAVINGETANAMRGANQAANCADAGIRGTPTILLPQSCGGPWADGFAPQ